MISIPAQLRRRCFGHNRRPHPSFTRSPGGTQSLRPPGLFALSDAGEHRHAQCRCAWLDEVLDVAASAFVLPMLVVLPVTPDLMVGLKLRIGFDLPDAAAHK